MIMSRKGISLLESAFREKEIEKDGLNNFIREVQRKKYKKLRRESLYYSHRGICWSVLKIMCERKEKA